MAYQSPYPFRQAIQLGHDVYELILTNWGNWQGDNDSLNFPVTFPNQADLAITSVSGIAISPRSLIDRVRVRYRPAVPVPVLSPGVALDVYPYNEFLVSVRQPLIGNVQGPLTFVVDPAHTYRDQYYPLGSATPATFGPALDPTTLTRHWTDTELRLLVYLRPPGLVSTLRYPTQGVSLSNIVDNGGGSFSFTSHNPWMFIIDDSNWTIIDTEELVRVWPISGRQRVRINVRNSYDVGQVTVRFTAVAGQTQLQIPFLVSSLFETPLVAATPIAVNQAVSLEVDNPDQTYLLMYAQVDQLPGSGRLLVNIDAVD